MFMARIRAGIINLPGEGILPRNINSGLNRTITFSFKIYFLKANQLGPWSGEIHQSNPEVL